MNSSDNADATTDGGDEGYVADLEAYRRRLDGAMLVGDVAWWEMDVETGDVAFHENKADMLGYSPGDFDHYEDFTDLVHPDDYERAMAAMRAHLEGRADKYDTEYRIRMADGEYGWFRDVGGVTARDDEGRPEKVTGIVVDVTDRKRSEARLQERNEELEVLNRVVRHDIRNDMTIAAGWLDVLADRLPDDEHEPIERAQAAITHTTRLTETVRDLLNVMERSDADIPLEPVALHETLDVEIERVQESFGDVDIERAYADDDVSVTANPMLSSVVGNLLTNAVQHNDADHPEVHVETRVEGDMVVIRIADNGIGIPSDVREHLFEQGASGPDSMGSGVGLYLVRTLVTAYGGSVAATDNDPRGTVFTVELPRA